MTQTPHPTQNPQNPQNPEASGARQGADRRGPQVEQPDSVEQVGPHGPEPQPTSGTPVFTSAPTMAKIAEFQDYVAAQDAVDLLSDTGFEVGATRIVGHDLKSVELVRGRMTYPKSALFGAGSGAWFGLLIGLLMALFVPVGVLWTLFGAIVIGAVWGAVFGLIAFAATGQDRNFHSSTATTASSYTIEVPFERAQNALDILSRGR